jgi:hypothetical protein
MPVCNAPAFYVAPVYRSTRLQQFLVTLLLLLLHKFKTFSAAQNEPLARLFTH